jgi:myo-inositol-1(or 4)-monophosphatase
MGKYDVFLNSAKEIARRAGQMVRSCVGSSHKVESKAKYDFVTEVDEKSEDMIRSFFQERFPEHIFFGEESVSSGCLSENEVIDRLPDDRYIWVVDPIDGTTNFIRGIPQYAISIALLFNREVVVGVVYDICMDRMFYTAKGMASFCNDTVLKVSNTDSLEKSIVVTSFPAADLSARGLFLKVLGREYLNFTSLRIWNCAAIAGVSIGSGIVDAYVELGIHLWDFCAAMLIIQNSGGVFTDVDGRPFHMHQRDVLATNPQLYPQVLQAISNN